MAPHRRGRKRLGWLERHGGPVDKQPSGRRSRVPSLPSNEEQWKIIGSATGSVGVVVQGPPGTGKSHTIANLISHYLASGQRVLVTAQSAQALQVLRDKMPDELQDLCVCLLGNSRESDKDLQRSVKGILARRQNLEETDYDSEVSRLDSVLKQAETELVSMDRTLADARAGETVVLEPIDGYRGTKAAIARQLNHERPERGWMADVFVHDTACPRVRLRLGSPGGLSRNARCQHQGRAG